MVDLVSQCRWILERRAIMGLLAVNLSLGCAAPSWDRVAPPVEMLVLGDAIDDSERKAALERGRMVYLVDCSKCHVPEPILA